MIVELMILKSKYITIMDDNEFFEFDIIPSAGGPGAGCGCIILIVIVLIIALVIDFILW